MKFITLTNDVEYYKHTNVMYRTEDKLPADYFVNADNIDYMKHAVNTTGTEIGIGPTVLHVAETFETIMELIKIAC
jgi:hypothetical protein